MVIRRVEDNTVESINRAIQDLEGEVRLLSQNRGDMRGRRLGNASDGQDSADYVTMRQLTRLQEQIKNLKLGSKKTTRVVPSVVPPGTLPPPDHPLDYSYYFADRRSYGDDKWGEYYDEVKGYTNAYSADSYYPESVPLSEIKERVGFYTLRAAQDGKRIMLTTPGPDQLDALIDADIDVIWPKVVRINCGDENVNSKEEGEALVNLIRGFVQDYNLPDPPGGYGYTLTGDQVLNTTAPQADNASFICIEAYVDPPGSATSQVNIDSMVAFIRTAKQVIPADKSIGIVMQGYARNYGWTNYATLDDLQIPVYMESYNDPRVVEIRIFSYCRASGTRDVDTLGAHLAERHKLIGAAIMGGTTQTLGCIQQPTGAILQEQFADLMDIAQGQGYDQGICQVIAGQTYVIAGMNAAFMALTIGIFNQSYTNLHAAQNPTVAEGILVKRIGDDTMSEEFSIIASNLAVRVAGAYRRTCRPSVITDAS